MRIAAGLLLITTFAFYTCAQKDSPIKSGFMADASHQSNSIDTAIFGNGCFWCTEAIFQQLEGVQKVISGYSGGHVDNPTYEQVCQKNTGHAEVLKVIYDRNKISFDELLEVFWQTHDPTTLNKQGN